MNHGKGGGGGPSQKEKSKSRGGTNKIMEELKECLRKPIPSESE